MPIGGTTGGMAGGSGVGGSGGAQGAQGTQGHQGTQGTQGAQGALTVSGGNLILAQTPPTSDPHVVNALYTTANALFVSTG